MSSVPRRAGIRKRALRALRSAGLPAAALERCDLMAVMIVPPLGYHDTSV
jgi:hypothetical protein